MHKLGGREELTANNMEDTAALWVRHAAVLVTLTVYAFFTSLRYFSDNSDGIRLLASAALLLVAAVVNSCGKPWVLRRACVRQLVAMSSLAKGTRMTTGKMKKRRPSGGGGGWWEWCSRFSFSEIKIYWGSQTKRINMIYRKYRTKFK